MTLQTISITKIVNGGYGFGHLESGQVALIHYTLPGETVTAIIEEKKKNHSFGKAQHIVTPHPLRRKPPCRYYTQCGGCDLQHCDYALQLSIKKDIIKELLARQQDETLQTAVQLVAPPIRSDVEFNYRQRIRLQVKDSGQIGFLRFRSHEIVAIHSCMLAARTINDSLSALISVDSFQALIKICSELELLRNPESNKTICIFHILRKPRPADKKAAEKLVSNIASIECVYFSGNDFQITDPIGYTSTKKNDRLLTLRYPHLSGLPEGLKLSWEASGFCQLNLAQNRKLIETVLVFCNCSPNDTVLDLFCGMGNFSIPLAQLAKDVLGIEGQGSAIRSARKNGISANLSNVLFKKEPVQSTCKKLIKEKRMFDILVIDPPRQGIPDMAHDLALLTKKKLIYISCDPATLCRDLQDLTRRGFTISKIQPIDMFPQTHHIETVVLLTSPQTMSQEPVCNISL